MTEPEAIQAITALFLSAMPTAAPGVQLATENDPVRLPSSLTASFAYLEIVTTTTEPLTQGGAGNRLERRAGWIQIRYWVPSGTRTDTADSIGDATRGVFNQRLILGPTPSDNPIVTQSTSIQRVSNDGKWMIRMSRTPFYYLARV